MTHAPWRFSATIWARRLLGVTLPLASLAGWVAVRPLAAQDPAAGSASNAPAAAAESARRAMVERDILSAGVKQRSVLAAMRATPREAFAPAEFREHAYDDAALPIGHGQTMPAPVFVAKLVERLEVRPGDKVLEIGAGAGYETAVLSRLAHEVYAIEIVPELGKAADERLQRLGYANVRLKIGDGYLGWSEHAPFDKMLLACSPETIPPPLVEQLREGGRIVAALGDRHQQTLYSLKKVHGQLISTAIEETFVPAMSGAVDAVRSPGPETPLTPLANAGFELEAQCPGRPDGWHTLSQAQLDKTVLAGHGRRCLTVRNRRPGRSAGASQGIALDGRRVQSLDVRVWVRCQEAQRGEAVDEEAPRLRLTFLDDEQQPIGEESLGPWEGSFSWCEQRGELLVPPQTRLAQITIGLFGAVGELSVDDIEIRTAPIVAQWPLLRSDISGLTRPLIR